MFSLFIISFLSFFKSPWAKYQMGSRYLVSKIGRDKGRGGEGARKGGGLNVALFVEPEMNDLRSGSIERGWRV